MTTAFVNVKPLTDRQKEVLTLMCEGFTTKEISILMECKESTLKNTICTIYRKLHVNSRAQALESAVGMGLWETAS